MSSFDKSTSADWAEGFLHVDGQSFESLVFNVSVHPGDKTLSVKVMVAVSLYDSLLGVEIFCTYGASQVLDLDF